MTKKILHILLISLFLATNTTYAQGPQKPAVDLISLDFKGMDVIDVLKLLAQRGNMNIAISKNVRGKVTMFLKDVSVRDAFEIILASNELAYEKSGNIMNVMTEKDYERLYGQKFHDRRVIRTFELQHANAADVSKALAQIKSKIGKVIIDEGANAIIIMDSPSLIAKAEAIILTLDKPIETRVFSLDYAKAEEVKPKIEEKLTKNIGFVQVDERTNKILITDLVSRMVELEALINELDERTREVLIEAKILEIQLNDEFRWGVNWDRIFQLVGYASGPGAIGANFLNSFAGEILPAATGSVIGGALEIGTLGNNDYHYLIQILETIGRTEVLSSPRIVVINNEEASILVGTNQPYATTGTTVSDTISQTTQQVTYVDLGIKLFVTPTINKNGYITMKIKPEVSSQTGTVEIVSEEGTTTRTTEIPVISTSEAETTVMVKDGKTIVLAGLIAKRRDESEDRIPFLADLPLIGYMFKNQSLGDNSRPERNELVIFLTPHIISGDVMSPEVSEYLTTPEIGKSEVVQPVRKRVRTKLRKLGQQKEDQEISQAASQKAITAKMKKVARYSSKMSRNSYIKLVRKRVLRHVNMNYPRSRLRGDVLVSFKLTSDGRLAGRIRILTPANETLKSLAIKSVRDAAPFPPFPRSIRKKKETFKLVITYK
jgi:type II secretory pathway component GspD/PulD (secretin)